MVVTTTSCSDFLTSPTQSQFSDDVIYSNEVLTEGVIFGIYNGFGEDRSYRNRLVTYMGVNTDIESHSQSFAVNNSTNNRSLLAVYGATPNLDDGFQTTDGRDPWSRIYSMIERSNLAIQGIRKYGSPRAGNTMGHLLGEALTLRAFLYNDLTKFWGDVPARFEPVTGNTIHVPRSNRDEIYDQIIADLQEATTLLPWAGESPATGSVERWNKGAAKALLARISLMAGGTSLRFNGNTPQLTPASAERRTAMYRLAQENLLDLVNSGKHKMTPSFEQIFIDNCQDIVTNGRDPLFEIPFSSGRGELLSYLGLRNEGSTKHASITIKGEVLILPSFFYDFDIEDLRRDVSVAPYLSKADKQEVVSTARVFYLAKWRAEWAASKVTSNDDGHNFCVVRYTDALLMLAEVENELNGAPTALAKSLLKDVRRRAFAAANHAVKVDAYVDGLNTKEAFFDALVKERAFEFAGENVRKWDLMRWGLLGTKLDEAKSNLTDLMNGVGNYATVPRTIYWRQQAANKDLIEFYGLNKGENADMTGVEDWTSKQWLDAIESASGLPYINEDWISKVVYRPGFHPDTYQLMPIMNIIVVNSQGVLSNPNIY